MPSSGVKEHLDVVEHIGAHGRVTLVDPAPDPLALEQLDETLGDCVVMAVAAPDMRHTMPWLLRNDGHSSLLYWQL